MKKINIPFSPPDIGENEINAVIDTLKSGWITTGPKTKEFERKIAEYCNVSKAVCLNSATAALELTLRILGITDEDEVITTAYTYTATCSPVIHVGAKLKLIDTAKDSYEMDYDALENAITENTKVIIPVEIAGVICDYDRIFEIVEKKKHLFKPTNDIQKAIGRIIVVSDAAHAFGAIRKGKKCGSIADFTTFSFHAVKNLTTAEGGAVTWNPIDGVNDDEIYKNYQILSLHGQTKDALTKTKAGAWEYDIIAPNYKCNMTDIMASIGLAQLDRYDDLLEKRQSLIELYNQLLKDLPLDIIKHKGVDFQSSGHLFLIRLKNMKSTKKRNQIIEKMAELGVSCNVHYKPIPLLTAYKNLGFDIIDYPNAYNQYMNEITLPLHTKLLDEDINYIINSLKSSIERGLYV